MPYRNGQIVNWKVKIKGIRPLLSNDDSDENAKKVGKEIYEILNLNMYQKYFKDFFYETGIMLDDLNFIENCKHLNDILEIFYDFCDGNLIWIE